MVVYFPSQTPLEVLVVTLQNETSEATAMTVHSSEMRWNAKKIQTGVWSFSPTGTLSSMPIVIVSYIGSLYRWFHILIIWNVCMNRSDTNTRLCIQSVCATLCTHRHFTSVYSVFLITKHLVTYLLELITLS